MGKLDDILNCWSNYLQGDDPETLEKAKERAEICIECPASKDGLHTAILPDYSISQIQGMYCSKKEGGCGCPLSTAVRSKNYKCPKGLW